MASLEGREAHDAVARSNAQIAARESFIWIASLFGGSKDRNVSERILLHNRLWPVLSGGVEIPFMIPRRFSGLVTKSA